MAKLTLDERLGRVVRLLMSVTNGEVVERMATRGFDRAERERGWALFDAATGRHVELEGTELSSPAVHRDEPLRLLAEWARTWIAVGDASLRVSTPRCMRGSCGA